MQRLGNGLVSNRGRDESRQGALVFRHTLYIIANVTTYEACPCPPLGLALLTLSVGSRLRNPWGPRAQGLKGPRATGNSLGVGHLNDKLAGPDAAQSHAEALSEKLESQHALSSDPYLDWDRSSRSLCTGEACGVCDRELGTGRSKFWYLQGLATNLVLLSHSTVLESGS